MDTIFKRRSVRKYTDTPVTDEQLKQLIKAGMAAPSAKNSQEWVFIVIRDKDIFNAFLDVHPNAFALKFADAAILVCADLSKEREAGQGWWIQDCSAAVQNILLEATDMGLGSLWMGVYPKEDRVQCFKNVCQLPEGIEPLGLVSIGEATKAYTPNDRYIEDSVFFNTYGTVWGK